MPYNEGDNTMKTIEETLEFMERKYHLSEKRKEELRLQLEKHLPKVQKYISDNMNRA